MSLSINIKKTFWAILPLMLAQIVQRFYPIIDNHYISILGAQALLIHNIQYSFISLGQYIGGATAVSCLVFWKRASYATKQSGVFYVHIVLCLIISVSCALTAYYFSNSVMTHFNVPHEYYELATQYFHLGLCNMVLQAIYLSLIGIVVAVSKERLSFIFSIILLTMNIFTDSLAIHLFFSGGVSPKLISSAMLAIISFNMIVVFLCIAVMFFLLRKKLTILNLTDFKEVFKIWLNELSGAFVSGVYPIVYIFQLGLIKTSGSLLVTYQLLMQLTAVFCIPILSTMQVALRDASAEQENSQQTYFPYWAKELTYFGFFPTQVLLVIFAIFPVMFIEFVFGYLTPRSHVPYIIIYLIASMIGQVGNALTVPIRARKKSHLVTIGYFISDVIVLIGGTQFLFILHIANPTTAGVVMLLYTCVYTGINAWFALRKRFR